MKSTDMVGVWIVDANEYFCDGCAENQDLVGLDTKEILGGEGESFMCEHCGIYYNSMTKEFE